ncbi:MAG: peptidoglycan-associated lipoprotein Pal [Gammaproteobacteria bacterium]|nr:peptidoglycan-associated lipoprotein Pal [Gammaproteobacteria bacterium]
MHVVAVALLAVGLTACQKPKQTKPTEQPPAAAEAGGTKTTGLGETGAGKGSTTLTAQQQALAALKNMNLVYFDYDSSEIPSQYLSVVSANAAYLVKYPAARVRLEGHTDERGSREYNIGLGERRAQVVRKALQAQGVADAQITTVSYGEERPAVPGHDEAAYAKNRRVEFAYAQ